MDFIKKLLHFSSFVVNFTDLYKCYAHNTLISNRVTAIDTATSIRLNHRAKFVSKIRMKRIN